ncbi:MAG: tRNA lysidine(34) synthetase TilS [Erysipelotrichaceae bacterium]
MKEKLHRYIIGVSGGPDSMALLDYMRNACEVVAVHVNYHKRESAMRDQRIVETYCKKYDIQCFIFDYVEDKKGNFQDSARVFRYEKFKEVYDLMKADGIMTAHHQDDVIETYLMQLKRGSTPSYWGIREKQQWKEYWIIRPLLDKTKSELVEYLNKNKIDYGIDESNLQDNYQRNQIRHQVVEKLDDKQRQKYIDEIKDKNLNNKMAEDELSQLIYQQKIKEEDLRNSKHPTSLLRLLMGIEISETYLIELVRQLMQCKQLKLEIDEYWLLKEEGWIRFIEKPKSYTYEIKEHHLIQTPYFKVVEKADSFSCATVSEDDFPLTIRNVQKGDCIKMKYGTKRISRWFIDHKIGLYEREIWPIVLNRHEEVVLVPKIGCSLKHYSNNPNLFVIK